MDDSIARLGTDGIAYLQSRILQGSNAEAEVNVSLSIANLVLHGWRIDAESLHQQFTEQLSEVRLLFGSPDTHADVDRVQRYSRQLSISLWNVLLLAALSHESTRPGTVLMGQFSTFVIAYREAMAASSSAAQGLVNAAANINHCYASVKLWLLLERMLSRAPPSQQGGHSPVPRAGPFVIWNELWPPFSILVNAHEAEVSKGQNTVRTTPGHSPE